MYAIRIAFVFSSGHRSEIEFCLGVTTKSSLNEASACACHVHWSLEWKLDFGVQVSGTQQCRC